jgi:hypothetical protein
MDYVSMDFAVFNSKGECWAIGDADYFKRVRSEYEGHEVRFMPRPEAVRLHLEYIKRLNAEKPPAAPREDSGQ